MTKTMTMKMTTTTTTTSSKYGTVIFCFTADSVSYLPENGAGTHQDSFRQKWQQLYFISHLVHNGMEGEQRLCNSRKNFPFSVHNLHMVNSKCFHPRRQRRVPALSRLHRSTVPCENRFTTLSESEMALALATAETRQLRRRRQNQLKCRIFDISWVYTRSTSLRVNLPQDECILKIHRWIALCCKVNVYSKYMRNRQSTANWIHM